MSIELALKDLIPFGSAFLGAITGGSITYSLSRAKEKKEEIKKRFEAMYEIQSINYKIIGRFKSLEGILQTYILSPVVMEQSTVTDKIQECLNEWAELYVLTLANAVYITEDIFQDTKQVHEDIRRLLLSVINPNITNINGQIRMYTDVNLVALQKATEKISILQDDLMEKEPHLVRHYMKKYNNDHMFEKVEEIDL